MAKDKTYPKEEISINNTNSLILGLFVGAIVVSLIILLINPLSTLRNEIQTKLESNPPMNIFNYCKGSTEAEYIKSIRHPNYFNDEYEYFLVNNTIFTKEEFFKNCIKEEVNQFINE